MNCTNHPEREAAGMCTYCGKPFCAECLVEVKGKMYCKADLSNVMDEAKQASNAQPTINITNANTNANTNVNGMNGMMISPKNKMVALILCLIGFMGLGGLHRFYVGKIGTGLLWLFTCGMFGIGTVVDLLVILSGSFRDRYGWRLR